MKIWQKALIVLVPFAISCLLPVVIYDQSVAGIIGGALGGLTSSIVFLRKPTNKIKRAPGATLLTFADFVFSRKHFSAIYCPIIVDMQGEYNEALCQNRIWKARWVRIRGTYSFFAAIGLDRALAFVSFFIKAWKSVN